MSDTTENNNDPLSADVGDKELTKMPLLPADRIFRFEVRKPTKVESKSTPGNFMLTIPCALVEDATAVDGEKVNKGFPIFHRIMVTPTEGKDGKQGRTVNQIASDVGKLCQAIGLKGITVRQVIDDPVTHLDGKLFDAKTRINKEKDGYPESNSLYPVPLA